MRPPEIRSAVAVAFAAALVLFALPIGELARLVAGGGLALGFVVAHRLHPRWWPPLHASAATTTWLLALMGWLAITALTGVDPGRSMLLLVCHGALVWLGMAMVGFFGTGRAMSLLFVSLVPPTLLALVSIVGPLAQDQLFDVSDNVVITADTAAFFGTVIALLAVFAPNLRKLPIVVRNSCVAVALVVIVAADSRSMAVAAVVAAGYGLAATGRGRLVSSVVLGAFSLALVAVAFLGFEVETLLEAVTTDVAAGGGRDNLWAAGWAAVSDRPLLGYGLGAQVEVLLDYRLESLFAIKAETTHSMVLYALVSGGWPALGLLLGLTVALLKSATLPQRIVLVALVVFGLGDAPVEQPGISSVIFGLAAAGNYSSSSFSSSKSSAAASVDAG